MTLDEIKQKARDENNRDIHIAIEMLCDYIESLELLINKPKGETSKEDIKKKGLK